ncbi:MAG: ABC transporter substrate-binding protein [Candidatus Eremiobacteraeota bacterium]|nr:ABC transporter substrate-binding protein [Candidatus Eremiobacteraeota bacterium]
MTTSRRTFLAATAGALIVRNPARALAAEGPIKLGSLTPLTGGGGLYGPSMRDAIAYVVDQTNRAGGILGRQLVLISEDDQTNADAGVRAARKLIDVDKVVAIMGTWASAVTTAVAPLCWESKTFLTTVSGADSITKLPHRGYLIRTQPNSSLQCAAFNTQFKALRSKNVVMMMPQTPFYQTVTDEMTQLSKAGGYAFHAMQYDATKTSLRSEVDEALRMKPDALYVGGYTPDVTVLAKELYRAGFKGPKVAYAYAVNQKFVDTVGADVCENFYTIAPSPAVASPAYIALAHRLGRDVDPYTAQCNDQASLVILAMQYAKEASGEAIKDNVRNVSQGKGPVVYDVLQGLKYVKSGKQVDYNGASGDCTFTPSGDITASRFRYEVVKNGKSELIRVA